MAARDRILERAPSVLARGGKPTVDDFARAAGISRASFYRHFTSREALLEALDVAPGPDARDRILAAAVELISAGGLRALSMDELADRAQVSRATVYRLFPGKDVLLNALIDSYSPLEPVKAALAARNQDPPELLMPELARTAFRASQGRTGLMRAFFFEFSGMAPETGQAAAVAITSVVAPLVMYVTAQMDAGRLRRMHPLLAL